MPRGSEKAVSWLSIPHGGWGHSLSNLRVVMFLPSNLRVLMFQGCSKQ
jgi:hypothetical protein